VWCDCCWITEWTDSFPDRQTEIDIDGSKERGERVTVYSREQQVCVCGDWDVELFSDLGWLREVTVDSNLASLYDETHKQSPSCDVTSSPSDWIVEQVS
jgi:hypothetical protein